MHLILLFRDIVGSKEIERAPLALITEKVTPLNPFGISAVYFSIILSNSLVSSVARAILSSFRWGSVCSKPGGWACRKKKTNTAGTGTISLEGEGGMNEKVQVANLW